MRVIDDLESAFMWARVFFVNTRKYILDVNATHEVLSHKAWQELIESFPAQLAQRACRKPLFISLNPEMPDVIDTHLAFIFGLPPDQSQHLYKEFDRKKSGYEEKKKNRRSLLVSFMIALQNERPASSEAKELFAGWLFPAAAKHIVLHEKNIPYKVIAAHMVIPQSPISPIELAHAISFMRQSFD